MPYGIWSIKARYAANIFEAISSARLFILFRKSVISALLTRMMLPSRSLRTVGAAKCVAVD